LLTVFRSNRAEFLASVLAQQLLLDPPGPWETVQVVVNTWPTSRWLGEQLAVELGGIAANLRFPFPGSHLRQIVNHLLGDDPGGADPWRATNLVWPLLELLPELVASDSAALLARWLEGDRTGRPSTGRSGNWVGRLPIPSTTSASIARTSNRPGCRALTMATAAVPCRPCRAGSPCSSAASMTASG